MSNEMWLMKLTITNFGVGNSVASIKSKFANNSFSCKVFKPTNSIRRGLLTHRYNSHANSLVAVFKVESLLEKHSIKHGIISFIGKLEAPNSEQTTLRIFKHSGGIFFFLFLHPFNNPWVTKRIFSLLLMFISRLIEVETIIALWVKHFSIIKLTISGTELSRVALLINLAHNTTISKPDAYVKWSGWEIIKKK